MNDKEVLKFLLLESKEYKHFIFRLYKIYDLCYRFTNGEIEKNKSILDYAESKIYTINGKELNEEEKIFYETKRLYKAISKREDDDDKLESLQSLVNIIRVYRDSLSKKDAKSKEVELETKGKISLMQAKYGLPISFLYAASRKFKEIYDAQVINNYKYDKEELNNSDIEDNKAINNSKILEKEVYYNNLYNLQNKDNNNKIIDKTKEYKDGGKYNV